MSYNQFFAQFQGMIDSINHDSDIANKLNTLTRLHRESQRLLLDARNEAAYELRQKYCGSDAAQISGFDRKYIDYWAKRWMEKRSLPRLKKKPRVDLSGVINLSGR